MLKGTESRDYLQYLSLGAEIAAGLSIPILIGYYLDTRLDTSPWFLLLGALLGIGVLILTSIRLARKLGQDD